MAVTANPELHDACKASAHPCFGCKMRLWRIEGIAGVSPPPAERDWGGPTNKERLDDMFARAKVNGYTPEYAGRAVLR